MGALEAWLEQHTIYCERNAARLRPEMCGVLQRDEHPACRGCGQGLTAVPLVPVKPAVVAQRRAVKAKAAKKIWNQEIEKETLVAKQKQVEKRQHARKICCNCKRFMPISGYGLCGKCYAIAKKAIADAKAVMA